MAIYFIVMPDGHKMFTYEPRIVAKWKALGGSVLENPVDSDGEAFKGVWTKPCRSRSTRRSM